MKPALSIVAFTTLAGAAQGLAVVLAAATIAGIAPHTPSTAMMLWVATGMLMAALAASFFHLGHPMRAWRAALMWRTSWMSREVIVLPAFICLTAAWALAATLGWAAGPRGVLPLAVVGCALLLWYCTAMIYACMRFIQEWAHPLTIVNYTLLGLASGLVVACGLASAGDEPAFAGQVAPWAMAMTALAWAARTLSLRRNARLKPKSTTQSATGIKSANVVQKSMGFTGSSFNTREFFHGMTDLFIRRMRLAFQALAFVVPLLLLGWGSLGESAWALVLAFPVQFAGLLAERWFFFAQAGHPQNIYYQVVS